MSKKTPCYYKSPDTGKEFQKICYKLLKMNRTLHRLLWKIQANKETRLPLVSDLNLVDYYYGLENANSTHNNYFLEASDGKTYYSNPSNGRAKITVIKAKKY